MKAQDRQVGPETDDAVAVHVMGWFYQCNQYEVGFYEWEPFQPSKRIDHAWRVLEGFTWPLFYTRLTRTGTGYWRCDIELNGGDGPVRSAYADNAPLSICRAALAAVGVDT